MATLVASRKILSLLLEAQTHGQPFGSVIELLESLSKLPLGNWASLF